MHYSALLLLHFCYFRVSHVGCNSIWPLCCHLQPLALKCYHVLPHLPLPHSGSLYFGHHWIHNPYRIYVETPFLWEQCVNHYFCGLFPLLELSYSSIYVNELLVLVLSAFNILTPDLTILTCYLFILSSILQINSPEGRSKAFSTCSSHILAVAVFFGSAAFIYLKPSSVSSMDQGKVSSVFYTCIVPMLNPLIYSLWDKDVKFVMNKILEREKCIWIESIAWCHKVIWFAELCSVLDILFKFLEIYWYFSI